MAVVTQKIDVGGLSTGALTIYTAPAGSTSSSIITAFTVHAAGVRDELKVHLVRSGDSVTSDNKIFDRAIAAGDTKNVPIVNQVLEEGDYLSVYSVIGSSLNVFGSIREVS